MKVNIGKSLVGEGSGGHMWPTLRRFSAWTPQVRCGGHDGRICENYKLFARAGLPQRFSPQSDTAVHSSPDDKPIRHQIRQE
ncbi:hypothetical protein [Cupriavidus laharis]|uniref:hypothetical protein n=1 Tax=Cupriavidus laharis TaxID=151654 RepID=UPI001CC67EA8|nr:hypothetical protein [Cupriavidus laharis]